MPYLDLPDCKLFYKIDDHTDPWTKPETVLFVHGFTENTEAWHAWVPHFSRRYRMVRIDQRGFGQSGAVVKDYPLTTERYVDDLARVIRLVAGGRAHVVGGKSGGISVMMLAATHPELVKTITVSSSPVTPPTPPAGSRRWSATACAAGRSERSASGWGARCPMRVSSGGPT